MRLQRHPGGQPGLLDAAEDSGDGLLLGKWRERHHQPAQFALIDRTLAHGPTGQPDERSGAAIPRQEKVEEVRIQIPRIDPEAE